MSGTTSQKLWESLEAECGQCKASSLICCSTEYTRTYCCPDSIHVQFKVRVGFVAPLRTSECEILLLLQVRDCTVRDTVEYQDISRCTTTVRLEFTSTADPRPCFPWCVARRAPRLVLVHACADPTSISIPNTRTVSVSVKEARSGKFLPTDRGKALLCWFTYEQ